MYNPTFISDIDLNEETLAHYGVKGMKWRRRKGKKHEVDTDHARDAYRRREQRKRSEKYYAQKMADDIMDGKAVYIGDRRIPGQHDRYGRKYVTGTPGMYSSTHETQYTRGSGANKYAKTDDVLKAVGARTLKRKKK